MNWIPWVFGYILIGIIASTIHIRLKKYSLEEYSYYTASPVLIGGAWPVVIFIEVIYIIFGYLPDKIDDLYSWVSTKGWKSDE